MKRKLIDINDNTFEVLNSDVAESPSINAARIAGRYMEGGHSVPIEKIVSLHACCSALRTAD